MPTEILTCTLHLICGLFASSVSFMSSTFVAAVAVAAVVVAVVVPRFFYTFYPRRHRSNRSNSSIEGYQRQHRFSQLQPQIRPDGRF